MKELKVLFGNNQEWVSSKLSKDPSYFKKMAAAQDPLYLWIGCSDSRVPANEIVGLDPGELFVHRNVANICPHTDFNFLSVLEYAVDLLKIEHVIVCGHYGCSGVKAAMEEHKLGLVDNWLRHIRDVYSRHKDELEAISNQNLRFQRLVELNVKAQVMNICHTTIVQGAWARNQPLWVHGWVYDMEVGHLKDLDCCYSHIHELDDIYKMKY